MRRILVENARRKSRLKRGGDRDREALPEAQLAASKISDDLIALDEALTQLAATDAAAAELVKLRYFASLTLAQAAECLAFRPERRTAPGFTPDPGYTKNCTTNNFIFLAKSMRRWRTDKYGPLSRA